MDIETPEELEAEKQYSGEIKEDVIRDEIVKEFGFDPEDATDKARIDKAVERELASRTRLSKAIGQKTKYRDMAKGAKPPVKKEDDVDIDARIAATLEQRDLDEMEYPDDIKNTIKQVAKINGVSVRKAKSDPYVAAKIDAWKKENGAEDAALGRKDNTSGGSRFTDDDLTPPDVDVTTPEGRAEYEKWAEDMKKKGH